MMKLFLFLKLGLVGIAMLGSPAMAKGREEEVSNKIFGGVLAFSSAFCAVLRTESSSSAPVIMVASALIHKAAAGLAFVSAWVYSSSFCLEPSLDPHHHSHAR
jgi:hypothetical protein